MIRDTSVMRDEDVVESIMLNLLRKRRITRVMGTVSFRTRSCQPDHRFSEILTVEHANEGGHCAFQAIGDALSVPQIT